ncbi:hypothetical protein DFH07DRAFT_777892 [Mycena maculata]|uniref:Uncharacterized protein n=1 Tax=Mycena maculata TaxID=230809 RepID=A0AAD7IFN3_9AGAR|nr:hypothetical protein DFH07DRAFT_777892 [Mycena maculata]
MPARAKRTQEEILDRRAHIAWKYRECNRAVINEKAKLHMRRRREALKKAPSEIQLEYTAKARKYRRDYLERRKEVPSSMGEVPRREKTATPQIRKNKSQKVVSNPKQTASTSKPSPSQPLAVPAQCTSRSPSPRSLGDIYASDSQSESEEESEQKDEYSQSDDGGWDADTERDEQATLHPERP